MTESGGEPLPSLTGQKIGAFQVETMLGRGGMGEVYRAFDTELHRDVALKIVLPMLAAEPGFVARFEREARAASAMSHPNLAHIYSAGRFQGRPYYAMELIDGKSLAERMREGRIPGPLALDYLRQAAEGLEAAFQKGIIHRDIKPENLMVDSRGRLKIVDFGLARSVAHGGTITSGLVLGTPKYMAPEQGLGGEVDHRTDIYSLGASFYHVLTGSPPFEGDTPVAILLKHVHETLPSVRKRRPEVPPPVAAIVERMMGKRPEDRYPSYADLIADLDRARQGLAIESAPTVASRPLPAPLPAERPREGMGILGYAAIGAAVLLAALLVWKGTREISKVRGNHAGGPPPASGGIAAGAGDSPPAAGTAFPAAGGSENSTPSGPPPTPTITIGTRTIPIPSYSGFDPSPLITEALRTKTLANMKKIETTVKVYYNEKEKMPGSMSDLAGYLEPEDAYDGWGRPITLFVLGETSFRLHSSGPDGKDGTADDLTIEKKAAPDFPR